MLIFITHLCSKEGQNLFFFSLFFMKNNRKQMFLVSLLLSGTHCQWPNLGLWHGLRTSAQDCGEKSRRPKGNGRNKPEQGHSWLSEPQGLLLRKRGRQRAEAQKEPEPNVTVSKAQSQSTRQEPKKRSTLSKNVQRQHSASALVTSLGAMALPYPQCGQLLWKAASIAGLGGAINLGVRASCLHFY